LATQIGGKAMGFFSRLKFGWRLGVTSLKVVARDKTLMLFPILSGGSSLVLIAAFVFGVGPEDISALLDEVANAETAADVPAAAYALAFMGYFGLFFITIYFNVALLGAARLSIEGKDTSFSDGVSIANNHLSQIIGWALLSGSIGLVLNILEANEKIGQWVAALIGTAWTLISYFVIPVMIFENENPFAAVGRSTRIMRDTWGENIGAQFGLGLTMFAAIFVTAVVCILLAVLIPGAALVTIPLLIISVFVIGLMGTTAKSVLTVGLYKFAVEGDAPGAFNNEELKQAFSGRNRRDI
jgi:Family of unknown function (DUF6159)